MNENNAYAGPERRSPPGNLAQRELAGAQFAAQQHLQTVKTQEVIIHGQQNEINRLTAEVAHLVAALAALRVQAPMASNQDFVTARKFVAAFPESYFESDDAVPRITFAHAIDHLDDAIKLVDRLDGYARSLAMHLWREHYIKSAPQFELLDDAYGVLSQIDNMIMGLMLKPTGSAPHAGGQHFPERSKDDTAAIAQEAAIRLELENQRAKQNFESRVEQLAALIRAGHKFDWPYTDAFDDGGRAYHEAKRRVDAQKEANAIAQMHQSTGMRCPTCCAKQGQPHADGCANDPGLWSKEC